VEFIGVPIGYADIVFDKTYKSLTIALPAT
jgi:hypothetical protein